MLRKELNAIPGMRAVIQDLSQAGFTAQRGFPVEFSVRGPDWDKLITLSQEMMAKLAASGTVVDLDTDYRLGMPELRITPNRARISDIGVSVDDVATALNALVGGVRAGKYSTGGRRLDVRVKLLASQRSRPEDLARLRVRTRSGELVPLSALVSYDEQPALQAITRRDRERAITIYRQRRPRPRAGRGAEGGGGAGHATCRSDYRAVLGGASVAFRESSSSLLFALFLGILIAYMILASQFNSYLHPVTVITILPLSIAGAAFALWVTNQSLEHLLHDRPAAADGHRQEKFDHPGRLCQCAARTGCTMPRDAMEKAGPIRLRPIVMTAISTLMAAIPPALGIGAGSEIRMPMAIAIIGGLTLSTVLSLIVVPAFYVATDGLNVRLRDKFRSRKGQVEVLELRLLHGLTQGIRFDHLGGHFKNRFPTAETGQGRG